MKDIKITTVTYEQFSDISFNPPAAFFIRNALGEYIFLHSGDRLKAQNWVNENYGVGKYTVTAAKIKKGKSKLESGGYSCTGVATRKGQQR